MENKNKYYDIAERIYDLDGEVYECVGSSLGRTFTGDKRTCVQSHRGICSEVSLR